MYISDLYQSVFLKIKEPGIGLIKYFIKPGDTIFDLGANIGRFTTLAASLTGKTGRVYSFEPLAYPRKIVCHMVALKRLSQVTIVEAAVSNESGSSIMTIPLKDGWKPKSALGYLGETRGDEEAINREEVKLITVDEFCESNKVDRLNFVKCDVEGFELHAFQGGQKTLSKFSPTIFCEIDKVFCAHNNIEAAEIFFLLNELGYQGYLPSGDDFLYPVSGFDIEEKKAEFFFIHNDKKDSYASFIKETV